jgi:hypothetical protein
MLTKYAVSIGRAADSARMVDLTRRTFLIGTAAALAGASVSSALADATYREFTLLSTVRAFNRRSYYSINIPSCWTTHERDAARRVFVSIDGRDPLDIPSSTRSSVIWYAAAGCELQLEPHQCLRLDVDGPRPTQVGLYFRDLNEPEHTQAFAEWHSFARHGGATVRLERLSPR